MSACNCGRPNGEHANMCRANTEAAHSAGLIPSQPSFAFRRTVAMLVPVEAEAVIAAVLAEVARIENGCFRDKEITHRTVVRAVHVAAVSVVEALRLKSGGAA